MGGDAPMQHDCLGDLAADAVERIEAGHRLLEHDACKLAACPVQRIGIGADHLLAVEQDAPRGVGAA